MPKGAVGKLRKGVPMKKLASGGSVDCYASGGYVKKAKGGMVSRGAGAAKPLPFTEKFGKHDSD